MPRRIVFLCLAVASALLPMLRQPSSVLARCGANYMPISVYQLWTERPLSGVPVLIFPENYSLVTAADGTIVTGVSGDVPFTVRVVSPDYAIVIVKGAEWLVEPGTTDIKIDFDYRCMTYVAGWQVHSRIGGSVPRPQPPMLPDGFVPSPVTHLAKVPTYVSEIAANVPWGGLFRQTAPEVTIGICDIIEVRTKHAAETAIIRWEEAFGEGSWRLLRDDAACAPDFNRPKITIRRETFIGRFSRYVPFLPFYGLFATPRTSVQDVNGLPCPLDLNGGACWAGSASIRLNPEGFEYLSDNAQVMAMVRQLGYALGLAEARACTASVMWSDPGCSVAPNLYPEPGPDDIASMNELLGVTLKVLQAAAPAPAPAPGPPPDESPAPPTEPEAE